MIRNKQEPEDNSEVALIKISNHREGEAAATIITGEEDTFAPEKLPLKIPLVKPTTKDGLKTIVYHCEAQY